MNNSAISTPCFAWLIEAPGPRYLAVRSYPVASIGEFYWTPNADLALRFFNEAQADMSAMAIRRLQPDLWAFAALLGEASPREHAWIAHDLSKAEDR